MGKLIFITGGSRSGKSSFGLDVAKAIDKKKIFIATCTPNDEEMKERVRLHQISRPSSWKTIEANKQLLPVLTEEVKSDCVIIIDCLTLFVSALLIDGQEDDEIKNEVMEIVNTIKNGMATVILVTNEVGSGLVPENMLGRKFRDIAGFCNQVVGKGADEAYYLVSGLPIQIKPAVNDKKTVAN